MAEWLPVMMHRRFGGSGETLRKLQAQRLENMRRELGVWGHAWTETQYEAKLWYEGGTPDLCWLHVDTEVITQLRSFIKVVNNSDN